MKIGFMVDDLGASQLSYYLTEGINKYAQQNLQSDFSVFYETLHQNSIVPNFPVLQIAEAFGQPGMMIATSLFTARKLIGIPGPKKKIFYVWDLDWMRGAGIRPYEVFRSTYRNPALTLVARSETHKAAIENAWNVKVAAVIDNFDLESFLKL